MDYKCLECDIVNVRKFVCFILIFLFLGKEWVYSKNFFLSFGFKMYLDVFNWFIKKKWLKMVFVR